MTSWVGFLALCVGMFMAILDIQIVATALPDIQASLHISTDRMSWIQTAYLIAEVIAIPLTGWLCRVMSTRWLFVTAICGFTLASFGCAVSDGFAQLIVGRVIQGFCGGVIIPTVFAAAFLLFPKHLQGRATLIAGLLAMLAPALGPLAGGWLTEAFTWRWLFLVNIVPGILVALTAVRFIRSDKPEWRLAGSLDFAALGLLALTLASFQILLKEAPAQGWLSWPMLGLESLCAVAAWACVQRCLSAQEKLVDLRVFQDRNFSVSCWFSFILGMGVYGSIYLMPMFLAYVRHHSPLEIGMIVIVTGAAQLVAAPVAAWADARFDARLVTGFGYGLLAIGLFAGSSMTFESDFDAMLWPQILRGASVTFCILPTARLALGSLPADLLPMASGLFNLMRNLGGAIGLALIDTVLEHRTPGHAQSLIDQLSAGDQKAAAFVGLPIGRLAGQSLNSIAPGTADLVRPLIERAATVASFNDAWMMLGGIMAVSLAGLLILFPATSAVPALSKPLHS